MMQPMGHQEDYTIIGKLGQGSSATVYKALHNNTGVPVALKCIPKAEAEVELIMNEVELMKNLDHPFIAMYYEIFEDDKNFYIAMELAEGGNLLDFLNGSKGVETSVSKKLFVQFLFALDYLHNTKHIAHRDLKFENILLDRYGDIKLVDFGLSKSFTKNNPILKTACGSLAYASPEILMQQPYTVSSDIWSAGVILFALMTGNLPFYDDNVMNLASLILSSDPMFPPGFDPEMKLLISRMVDKDPEMRPTIPQIFDFECINKLPEFQIIQSINWDKMDYFVNPETEDCDSILTRINSPQTSKVFEPRPDIPATYKITKRNRILNEFHDYLIGKPPVPSLNRLKPSGSGSMSNLKSLIRSPNSIVLPIIRPKCKRPINRTKRVCSVSPVTSMQRMRSSF